MKKLMLLSCMIGTLNGAAAVTTEDEVLQLGDVTVTGTREAESLAETPGSIGSIKQNDIRMTGPTHPQQLLGQIPGVAIGVTNGEGHTTAIRQPFTTSPLYLYLEDGIPTRATGFFNHNALYEINLPQAGGVEVIKGPGTALYGSDAIGGVVNILTKAPSAEPEASVSGEAGSFGWYRLLGDASTGMTGLGGLRAQVNDSHTDGWRDQTAYDRLSGNFRWDFLPTDDSQLKTILGMTKIDQQTGANSPLIFADYENNPTKNNFAIAYRKVDALRLSTNYDKEMGANTLVSITPYLRKNYMDLNGSYNLSFDPRIEKTDVWSLGVMAKWRRDFPNMMRARLILGVDVDHSPGTRTEDNLIVSSTGSGADRSYNSYVLGTRIYDYNVTYQSVSPYVHTEISPTERVRVTAGVRYDTMKYDMSNNLASGAVAATVNGSTKYYYQIADASVDFSHVSPKLGLTYAFNPDTHLYVAYNHGFRVPSESQLFRAGNDGSAANAQVKTQDALALKPIKADQYELGARGDAGGWEYDAAVYVLTLRDDLVSQKDLATNVTVNTNAGKTQHKGVELGLGRAFTRQWRFDASLSYAKHTYVDWVTTSADYSGKEMEAAPRWLGNTRLTWTPQATTTAQLEWVKIGPYWLEASNSPVYGKYDGYDLLNVRVNHELKKGLSAFARIMNLTDKRYADSASVSSNTPVYSPGLPRAYYGGIEAKW
jgi:outer membrane receptor protein involved in Fe transport